MASFNVCPEAEVKPAILEELLTLLLAEGVAPEILDGFPALGIRSCGVIVSLADSDVDCRQALSEMFGVDKAKGPLHRLEASILLQVWNEAKTRSDTQQVEATARALSLPLELPHGSWRNLLKAFASRYGDSTSERTSVTVLL